MTNFDEIDRLTIEQFELLMKAQKLIRVDHDYRSHLDGFLAYAVQAQKKSGKNKTKPVYSTFRKFYDYDKAQKEAMGESVEDEKIEMIRGIKKIMERGSSDG